MVSFQFLLLHGLLRQRTTADQQWLALLAQGVATSYSWACPFPDPGLGSFRVVGASFVLEPVSVRRPVPTGRLVGQSAAKWPTPPQYMHRPCARRRWRSAGVSFFLAADRSIGPAAMAVLAGAAAVAGVVAAAGLVARGRCW